MLTGAAILWILLAWALIAAFTQKSESPDPMLRRMLPWALGAAICVLFVSAHTAANLGISDSVEYAVGGERMYSLSNYSLPIAGRLYPPRYPPFFSLMFAAPAHLLFGAGLGTPVYLVLFISLIGFAAGVIAAFRMGGARAAAISGLLLLLIPEFRRNAQVIMSDGPLVAFTLVLLLLKLGPQTLRTFAAAGIITALGTLFRAPNALLAAPFVVGLWKLPRKDAIPRLAALVLPIAGAAAIIAAYNDSVFGSPLRSGYNFWSSVPYDFPSLTFSSRYLIPNLRFLFEHSSCTFLLLVIAAIAGARRSGLPPVAMRFTLIVGVLLAACYLPYYWRDLRFFSPLAALLAVDVGIVAAHLPFRSHKEVTARELSIIFAAAAAFGLISYPLRSGAPRVAAAEELARKTPQDAVIITALDPVYLEPLALRGTARTVIPASRRVEFASKICRIWPPIAMAAPASPIDHRNVGLRGPGSIDPVAHTALEEPDYIAALLKSGTPIYLQTDLLMHEEEAAFQAKYRFLPVAEGIVRLELKQP